MRWRAPVQTVSLSIGAMAMTDRLAICLMTSDRVDLSRATLESLAAQNPNLQDHILLHADDGSADLDNSELACAHGFETVYEHRGPKLGQIPALATMWNLAHQRGADWILHLENDQLSVRPLPELDECDCIRLYGEFKMEDPDHPRSPAGRHIIGTREPISWHPYQEGWEVGVAHWGGQASITKAPLLVEAIQGAERLKHISLALARILTIRPVENITYHIGVRSTPGHWLRSC